LIALKAGLFPTDWYGMGVGGGFGKFGRARAAMVARRDERYKTESLRCHVGQVVDISSSGMRVRCKEKPPFQNGGVVAFGITAGTQKLPVEGRIVWIRRASWRSSEYEIGVEFRDQRPAVRAALSTMGRFGFAAGDRSSSSSRPGSGAGVRVEVEDLYGVLGVSQGATEEQIRTAFRSLARELHPDVSQDEATQEKFLRVTKAYAVLRDPESKKRYDDLLARLNAA
jgi:Tfp pilus assembly protein PilZ